MDGNDWGPKIAKKAKEVVKKACDYNGWYPSVLQRSQMEHVAAEAMKALLAGESIASISPDPTTDDEGPGAA